MIGPLDVSFRSDFSPRQDQIHNTSWTTLNLEAENAPTPTNSQFNPVFLLPT